MTTRPKRTIAAALTGVALLAAGCGENEQHANDLRPASPIVVNASITPTRISVSPARVGAGPLSLVVANVTGSAQTVTLESADAPGTGGPGTTTSTPAIEPAGTATLKTSVDPGRYSVRVEGDDIAPGAIEVGPPRESSQNDILLP